MDPAYYKKVYFATSAASNALDNYDNSPNSYCNNYDHHQMSHQHNNNSMSSSSPSIHYNHHSVYPQHLPHSLHLYQYDKDNNLSNSWNYECSGSSVGGNNFSHHQQHNTEPSTYAENITSTSSHTNNNNNNNNTTSSYNDPEFVVATEGSYSQTNNRPIEEAIDYQSVGTTIGHNLHHHYHHHHHHRQNGIDSSIMNLENGTDGDYYESSASFNQYNNHQPTYTADHISADNYLQDTYYPNNNFNSSSHLAGHDTNALFCTGVDTIRSPQSSQSSIRFNNHFDHQFNHHTHHHHSIYKAVNQFYSEHDSTTGDNDLVCPNSSMHSSMMRVDVEMNMCEMPSSLTPTPTPNPNIRTSKHLMASNQSTSLSTRYKLLAKLSERITIKKHNHYISDLSYQIKHTNSTATSFCKTTETLFSSETTKHIHINHSSSRIDNSNNLILRKKATPQATTTDLMAKKKKKIKNRLNPNIINRTTNNINNRCYVCGKNYARPSTLKTHLRTHSGEKPYKCQTCNKAFSQAANLTAHTRIHSGEKPFPCPVCHRRFSQSSSVTTHMRTHSGERPYQCNFCGKSFSDSSTLTKHLRIHSGEKPYKCPLCFISFSQSGNLNRHLRVHM